MAGRKARASTESVTPVEQVEQLILLIRGERVLLDADLAAMYGVETKVLVRAVKRNHERFPSDFMFQVSEGEFENLRFHFGTSSSWGGRRYPPYAFTEHGVAMLSSVLRSARAVQVNIAIIRVFVRLRQTLALHKELAATVAELERKIESHDEGIRTLFDAIRQLMDTTPPPKRKAIGFHVKEAGPMYRVRRVRRARG
jgi:phage regulator Rha-like protein